MTYTVDRSTNELQKYKDTTLDCLATYIKNRVNKYAELRGFPEIIKTAIITRFTANIIGDNLPLLMIYRESCTFNYEGHKRICNIGLKYYLSIPDQTYLLGLIDWVSRAINKSLIDINQEQIGIEIATEERSQSYPLDNSSYNNATSPYIVGNFNIIDDVEV